VLGGQNVQLRMHGTAQGSRRLGSGGTGWMENTGCQYAQDAASNTPAGGCSNTRRNNSRLRRDCMVCTSFHVPNAMPWATKRMDSRRVSGVSEWELRRGSANDLKGGGGRRGANGFCSSPG
jgi:hypothetical protein